jgi:hypothetical protein
VLALRWAGRLLLVLLRLPWWVDGTMVVHHPVLQRGTTGWSSHIRPLLGFLVGADCIIRYHDVADELWKCPFRVERHALL